MAADLGAKLKPTPALAWLWVSAWLRNRQTLLAGFASAIGAVSAAI